MYKCVSVLMNWDIYTVIINVINIFLLPLSVLVVGGDTFSVSVFTRLTSNLAVAHFSIYNMLTFLLHLMCIDFVLPTAQQQAVVLWHNLKKQKAKFSKINVFILFSVRWWLIVVIVTSAALTIIIFAVAVKQHKKINGEREFTDETLKLGLVYKTTVNSISCLFRRKNTDVWKHCKFEIQ